MDVRLRTAFSTFYFLISILLCSCASRHLEVPANGPPPGVPRYVQLFSAKQIATLHFPAGIYSFYAVDSIGYYYQAPGNSVIQHTGGRPVVHHGGIFVSKQNPKKLRGYIFLAGGLTHVGDLSRTPHSLGP